MATMETSGISSRRLYECDLIEFVHFRELTVKMQSEQTNLKDNLSNTEGVVPVEKPVLEGGSQAA